MKMNEKIPWKIHESKLQITTWMKCSELCENKSGYSNERERENECDRLFCSDWMLLHCVHVYYIYIRSAGFSVLIIRSVSEFECAQGGNL